MAFDAAAFVASKTKKKTGGFDVDQFLISRGIEPKADLSTVEGLSTYATRKGLGKEAAKITGQTPELSFLQRLGAGLGAFNPANAVYETERIQGKDPTGLLFPKTYATDIAKGLGAAITGRDLQPDRKMFADVLEQRGVEDGIQKFGLGFMYDVLLDPTTYFGGAIAKGITRGTSGVGGTALTVVGKVAPKVEMGLRMTGQGVKDAFGKAFVAGYGSSKGAADDVLTFLSKRDKARLGIAASNLNRLGTGVLTKNQQEELALKLIAGKRAEFAAREAGTAAPGVEASADPLVQRTIRTQTARSQKFGTQLGLENPYETYFPFIKKDKLTKFLDEVQTKQIKVGSEGYRKQFKNLLTNENLELDPAKAFFSSEAAQVSDRMTRDFLEGFAARYGKPLEVFYKKGTKAIDEDAARKAGYKLIREKGNFGSAIGWAPEHDAKLLSDLITPEFQTLSMLGRATGFDAVTNLFKRSVTGLFLPFHVRNFTSGIIQNYEVLGLAALNPSVIASGQKLAYHLARGTKPAAGTIKLGGKEQSVRKVYQAFADRFGSDTFYQNDFLQALDIGSELRAATPILSKEAAKATLKTAGLGADAIPFRMGRAIGQYIEHQQKATAYIAALGQGKHIKEALRLAERAGFDYRKLTAFESQVMRRLVPFYSFTRKNIELQLKTLGENPQRINQVLAFFNNMGEQPTGDEKQSLPEYLKNAIGIKMADTPEGLKQYISSFGTPVEAFAQLFNTNSVLFGLSQTNPLIKAPIEIGIGKDSFRQRDLKDVYDAREYKNAPQIIKDLLDIKESQKDVLDKGPDGKLHKVGERTIYVADPERLLIARSLFTSRGVTYLDQIFGGDLHGFAKFLKLTTGIKPQQIDVEMVKDIKERDMRRALEDLLVKTGNAAQFTRTFVPKD